MPYLYLVTGNMFFALSSIAFAHFSRTQSVLWMNITKSGVALISAFLYITFITRWSDALFSAWPFFASGFIGLALGDMFLLSAFARIGSARTMILWGFQPIFVGIGSYILFGETISPSRLLAIALLIGCLGTFSFESFKKSGRWEVLGLLMAMTGVLLDAVGLFFTKYGFQQSLQLPPIEGHFFRCLGAMACFGLISLFNPVNYFKRFTSLSFNERKIVLVASFFGTFLSLLLAMTAIQIGHLPSLAALSVTTPLFTSMFEHLYERRWPSTIFLAALLQFLIGFYLLITY